MAESDVRVPAAEFDALVAAWLRHAASQRAEDFWTWERAHDLVRENAAAGWALVTALFERATRPVLQNLAAGPLQGLLIHHGAAVIARVEARAARDPEFRDCLAEVWLSRDEVSPEVGERLMRASGDRMEILDADAGGEPAPLEA